MREREARLGSCLNDPKNIFVPAIDNGNRDNFQRHESNTAQYIEGRVGWRNVCQHMLVTRAHKFPTPHVLFGWENKNEKRK